MSPRASPSGTLVLVPTDLERGLLHDLGGLETGPVCLETCGFGAVAAAARTAQLLARLRPRRALLLGLAGSFDLERAPLETARTFAGVEIEGLGAGSEAERLGPAALGFPQWPGSSDTSPEPLGDELPLVDPRGASGWLLTVCSASGSGEEARARRERHPRALAEDMEGFSVALACALERVPLAIVRGLANPVGARSGWRVRQALRAARELAQELLGSEDWGSP